MNKNLTDHRTGYIISQLPATVYLARGRPQIQMPLHVIAWSVITACMAAMTTGWSFVLCRFLVGLAEGPFLPMVSVMSSSWYTKEEAPLRMAIWHAGNIASNVFSGLLAAGILTNMDGVANMRAWMWFFILEVSRSLEFRNHEILILIRALSGWRSVSLPSGAFLTFRIITT